MWVTVGTPSPFYIYIYVWHQILIAIVRYGCTKSEEWFFVMFPTVCFIFVSAVQYGHACNKSCIFICHDRGPLKSNHWFSLNGCEKKMQGTCPPCGYHAEFLRSVSSWQKCVIFKRIVCDVSKKSRQRWMLSSKLLIISSLHTYFEWDFQLDSCSRENYFWHKKHDTNYLWVMSKSS